MGVAAFGACREILRFAQDFASSSDAQVVKELEGTSHAGPYSKMEVSHALLEKSSRIEWRTSGVDVLSSEVARNSIPVDQSAFLEKRRIQTSIEMPRKYHHIVPRRTTQ